MLDLAPETESRLMEYAAAEGISTDAYINRLLEQNAPAVQKIVLSEKDFARFVEILENPPAPTEALRDAMAEYQRLKAAHPESNL